MKYSNDTNLLKKNNNNNKKKRNPTQMTAKNSFTSFIFKYFKQSDSDRIDIDSDIEFDLRLHQLDKNTSFNVDEIFHIRNTTIEFLNILTAEQYVDDLEKLEKKATTLELEELFAKIKRMNSCIKKRLMLEKKLDETNDYEVFLLYLNEYKKLDCPNLTQLKKYNHRLLQYEKELAPNDIDIQEIQEMFQKKEKLAGIDTDDKSDPKLFEKYRNLLIDYQAMRRQTATTKIPYLSLSLDIKIADLKHQMALISSQQEILRLLKELLKKVQNTHERVTEKDMLELTTLYCDYEKNPFKRDDDFEMTYHLLKGELSDCRSKQITDEIVSLLDGAQTFQKKDLAKLRIKIDQLQRLDTNLFSRIEYMESFFKILLELLESEQEIQLDRSLSSSSTSSSLKSSSSLSNRSLQSVPLIELKQQAQAQKKTLRGTILQQPVQTKNIPMILIIMHGAALFVDGDCKMFMNPMNILIRRISSAPQETNSHDYSFNKPEWQSLLEQPEFTQDATTIERALQIIKKEYSDKQHQSIDGLFLKANGLNYITTINNSLRNMTVINFPKSEVCKKLYKQESTRRHGIYVLNDTTFFKHGTNLLFDPEFISFCEYASHHDKYIKVEKKNSDKYVIEMTNEVLLQFLQRRKLCKQAFIIDTSCETNFFYKKQPIPEVLQQTELLEVFFRTDAKMAQSMVKYYQAYWKKTNTHVKDTIRDLRRASKSARKLAKRSKENVALVRKGSRKTR